MKIKVILSLIAPLMIAAPAVALASDLTPDIPSSKVLEDVLKQAPLDSGAKKLLGQDGDKSRGDRNRSGNAGNKAKCNRGGGGGNQSRCGRGPGDNKGGYGRGPGGSKGGYGRGPGDDGD